MPLKLSSRKKPRARCGVKLARSLWHLLKYQQPFNPEGFAKEEAKLKRQKLQRL